MLSGNDPVDSFFNTLQVVKGTLSPLESSFQKAAKDFECCWLGSKNCSNNIEVFEQWNGVDKCNNTLQLSSRKKKRLPYSVSNEKKRGFSIRSPIKICLWMFPSNPDSDCPEAQVVNEEKKEKVLGKVDGSCASCFDFALGWSLLLNNLFQAIPNPLKMGKKWFHKSSDEQKNSRSQASDLSVESELEKRGLNFQSISAFHNSIMTDKLENHASFECLIGFILDRFNQNPRRFDKGVQDSHQKSFDASPHSSYLQFDYLKPVAGILDGRKVDLNAFLGNLRFARVGGMPSDISGEGPSVKEEGDACATASSREEFGGRAQKLAYGLLSIPLSNVERLMRSTLSSFSLSELAELLPHTRRPFRDHPDKKELFSVHDFFRYTETEGRRFFEELDRDGDEQVTLEDLEVAMRKRRLPKQYAKEFMGRARSHLFSKSFGWKQFLSLVEQKEPTILRAYTTLCLNKSGTLQKSEILASLKNAGLPANEENAAAMMRYLNAEIEESISYGHFRNFMLLLPSDRLRDDPRCVWFEAATVVAVVPAVEVPAGSVLKSALAGGLSCAISTALMFPVDTIKTRVQSSTLNFPEIISKLPEIGVQGLYRGSIPAILGQFSSHGLRTGIFEASKLVLTNVAPAIPELQAQSLASFCSTFLGTAVRIPCEVLKQRLQAGIYDNLEEAIGGTWQQDGLKGFFRGTGATLCREVPFYVAGMGLYAESKKAAQRFLERELEPWETIAVGALSGGLAAVATTPFDVLKTRMMTAQHRRSLSMSVVAFSILRREGPLGLFKGALPRFFWIAPLGAMNFAGYELAKKSMDKN